MTLPSVVVSDESTRIVASSHKSQIVVGKTGIFCKAHFRTPKAVGFGGRWALLALVEFSVHTAKHKRDQTLDMDNFRDSAQFFFEIRYTEI